MARVGCGYDGCRQDGVELRSVRVQRVQHRAEMRASVPRPGQAGSRKKQQANHKPHPDAAVPGHRAASAPRAQVGQQQPPHPPGVTPSEHPQNQATTDHHPQPACRHLGVLPPERAEVQVAVQVIEPCGQRGTPPPSGQRSLRLAGVRVDVDGALLLPEAGHVEHDAGGPVGGVSGQDG